MKKFFKWFIIIAIVFIAILMILPFVFQGKITQIAKEEINKNLNAQVDFNQVDLSFLSAFPNVSLKINGLSVIGVDAFAGDTLAYLEQFQVKVALLSVFSEPIEIKSIIIRHPSIYARVLKDEKANWDIAKGSEEPNEEGPSTDDSNMTLSLKEFKIIGADIIYDDRSMDVLTNIQNMDFSLSGDLSADFTSLNTQTEIESFSFQMDGIPYFNKNRLSLDADIDADLKNSKYTFKDNLLQINALELGFDGSIAMPSDDVLLDLSFEAQKTTFKQILSLIPAIYKSDFQDIKTEGTLSLRGFVKGVYNENKLPSFDLSLLVQNGWFQYPDLPAKVENIAMDLHIENTDGIEDHTVLNLKKFHMDMAGHPFDMTLLLKTPVSDPDIDGQIKGIIDLGKIKDLLPSEDMKMSGMISTDIELKGKMSAIENEKYNEFHAVGNIAVQSLKYTDADYPQGFMISSAKATLSPQYIKLDELKANIGSGDMSIQGKIENFLAYYFNQELLKGSFTFSSNYLDFNDLMSDEMNETEGSNTDKNPEMKVVEVPKNIDFSLMTSIKTLHYDQIEMKNVSGGLVLKDGLAKMQNLQMEMLDGQLKMNGSYSTEDIHKPVFNFDMEAVDFNVRKSFEAFNTIQKLVPIARHAEGDLSVNMNMNGFLLSNMEPDLESLNSRGRLKSNNLTLKNADLFQQLGALLKVDRFNQFTLAVVDFSFIMENGDLMVKPFETKFGKSKMMISGSQKLDQSIDYGIDFIIPSSELGSKANTVANQLLGEAGKFGVDLKTPEEFKFKALVGGTLTAPKVSLDLKDGAASIAEDLKKQAEEKLRQEADKVKKQAIEEAKKQAAQLMSEADQQGKKLISEAQKIADQAKAEANRQAEAAKAEAYKQAAALEKEAGNDTMKKLLAKTAADKMRSEADKNAEAFKQEAARQANKGIEEARKQSDALKAQAKTKGDLLVTKAEKL